VRVETNEDTKIKSLDGRYCDTDTLMNRILEYHFLGEEEVFDNEQIC